MSEHDVKAVVRDLGKTKSGKQKAAKEARKIVEMKGKQMKDELLLAMIQFNCDRRPLLALKFHFQSAPPSIMKEQIVRACTPRRYVMAVEGWPK